MEAIDIALERLLPRFFESSFHAAIYVPVVAQKLLREFIPEDLPDEIAFAKSVGGMVKRALHMHRGNLVLLDEMGGLLAAAGECQAAAKIEALWDELLTHYDMTPCCAYIQSQLPPEFLIALRERNDDITHAEF